ncbi:MAG TPA: LysM domain-containing protein [Pseudomonadales bacterium]|nr:LysM domain-containing protein [Pseudomonadales bacterium]
MAAEEPIRDDAPGTYIVQKGDTLWDIANTFLTQPWRWPDLWRVNPEIANPHLIYPGDTIRLRYVDGQPTLELSRGIGGRTMKLTPEDTVRLEPRVRATPLLSAIPTINLEAIGPFLSSNRIVTNAELEGAAYVVQGDSGRIILGAGDRLFARGVTSATGDSLSIVRRGGTYVDPDTGEVLGLEAEELGSGQLVSIEDDIGTLLVSASRSDIRIGDRLLPTEQRAVASTFFPSAPDEDVSGRMLAVLDGVTQVGQFSVVALSVGEEDGIEVGHVLAIRRQGPLVRDRIAGDVVRMPSSRAGLLMVFRTFERLSYGIVLEAAVPLAVLDEVTNP